MDQQLNKALFSEISLKTRIRYLSNQNGLKDIDLNNKVELLKTRKQKNRRFIHRYRVFAWDKPKLREITSKKSLINAIKKAYQHKGSIPTHIIVVENLITHDTKEGTLHSTIIGQRESLKICEYKLREEQIIQIKEVMGL